MANTKVTQHVIANNAITADQLASAAVTDAKLHSTLDLSGKTLTLPATAIPSASTATTQAASDNSTKLATTAYVTTAIGNLVDSAPTALDTLNELAAALGDDANFSGTVTTSLAGKLPLAGGTMTGALVLSGAPTSGLHAATKTYVDTADALKLNLTGGTLTGDLILNTTTALQIPVGTTGQRPTAATGQIRWNSTDGAIEVYNGTAWTAVGTGSSNKVLDTFTGDGSTTTFTLSVTPANEDAIMVFIDGAYQEKSDYVLTNNSLVLDTAPLSAEKIAVHITTAAVHDGTSAVNNQFTATAGQTAFTLTQDPSSENNTQVYINGVYQQKTDYTVVGTTLTFDTGLTVGDVVEVNMFTVATLGNTDTVTEGVSNLYHTTARARGAISVSGNALSYNSSTGVLTSNFEESPAFTGNVDVAGSITVGNNDSILAENNLRFKSGGAAYIDHNTVGQDINFRISNSSSLDTTIMTLDAGVGSVGINNSQPSSTFKLDVGGSIRAAGSAPGLTLRETDLVANQDWLLGSYSGTFAIRDVTGGTYPVYIEQATPSSTLYLDSSGNVGIGTSSPDTMLHLSAGSTGVAGGGDAAITMTNKYDNPDNSWKIAPVRSGVSNTGLEIRDVTDSRTDMVFDGAGNVGIGTSSPATTLEVIDPVSGNFAGAITVGGNGSNRRLILEQTDVLTYRMGGTGTNSITQLVSGGSAGTGTVAMTIDETGNVGIGTTNPGARLHVQTAHTSTDVTAANSNSTLNVANSGSGNGVYNAIKFAANQQDMYIMSFNNNQQADRRLGFFLGSVAGDATTDERLSILGNGNVGIGTTAPAEKVHVHNSSSTGSQIQFTDTGTGLNAGDGFRVGYNGSVGQLWLFENADIRFATNNTERLRINQYGDVSIDDTLRFKSTGGTDVGYKFNLGFIRGGSGGYNHIKTNLPSNGNKMMKFEFDGWTYSGTNYHESVTFYTYNGQTASPYNLSYADWGTGGGIANVYYSSDSYVVIVIQAHVSYTGGFLYAQCGRGHYVSDLQILATGSNSTTSGVF